MNWQHCVPLSYVFQDGAPQYTDVFYSLFIFLFLSQPSLTHTGLKFPDPKRACSQNEEPGGVSWAC